MFSHSISDSLIWKKEIEMKLESKHLTTCVCGKGDEKGDLAANYTHWMEWAIFLGFLVYPRLLGEALVTHYPIVLLLRVREYFFKFKGSN